MNNRGFITVFTLTWLVKFITAFEEFGKIDALLGPDEKEPPVKKINVILFLLQPSPESQIECDGLSYLNYPVHGTFKQCDTSFPPDFKYMFPAYRKGCNCGKLLKKSLKSLIHWARYERGMATGIISTTNTTLIGDIQDLYIDTVPMKPHCKSHPKIMSTLPVIGPKISFYKTVEDIPISEEVNYFEPKLQFVHNPQLVHVNEARVEYNEPYYRSGALRSNSDKDNRISAPTNDMDILEQIFSPLVDTYLLPSDQKATGESNFDNIPIVKSRSKRNLVFNMANTGNRAWGKEVEIVNIPDKTVEMSKLDFRPVKGGAAVWELFNNDEQHPAGNLFKKSRYDDASKIVDLDMNGKEINPVKDANDLGRTFAVDTIQVGPTLEMYKNPKFDDFAKSEPFTEKQDTAPIDIPVIPDIRPNSDSFYDIFGIVAVLKSAFSDGLMPSVGPMFAEDNKVDVKRLGSRREPSLYEMLRSTLKNLKKQSQMAGDTGFLLICIGGNYNELTNLRSPLIQSLKYVKENTAKDCSLTVITTMCEPEPSMSNERDTKREIPFFAAGPKAEKLLKGQFLFDLPKYILNTIMTQKKRETIDELDVILNTPGLLHQAMTNKGEHSDVIRSSHTFDYNNTENMAGDHHRNSSHVNGTNQTNMEAPLGLSVDKFSLLANTLVVRSSDTTRSLRTVSLEKYQFLIVSIFYYVLYD